MRLKRATIVYGLVILLSAFGVWAVLAIGQNFIAPEDLAGKWTLSSLLPANSTGPREMRVDQSGRFFQISIENGPNLNLVLDDQSPLTSIDGQSVTLALSDGPWHLTFQGIQGSDEMRVALTGADPGQSGVWNAKRLFRKFPPDVFDVTPAGAH